MSTSVLVSSSRVTSGFDSWSIWSIYFWIISSLSSYSIFNIRRTSFKWIFLFFTRQWSIFIVVGIGRVCWYYESFEKTYSVSGQQQDDVYHWGRRMHQEQSQEVTWSLFATGGIIDWLKSWGGELWRLFNDRETAHVRKKSNSGHYSWQVHNSEPYCCGYVETNYIDTTP